MKKIISILTILVLIIALFFGYGIFMRPKIKISHGAIRIKTPVKTQMEFMALKLMFLSEDVVKKFENDLIKSLKEYKLPDDKIDLIIKTLKQSKDRSIDKAKLAKLDLKPHEQNIVIASLSKAATNLTFSVFEQIFTIPQSILFFEIRNEGLSDAENVYIKINLTGKIEDIALESINKQINKSCVINQCSLEYASISPDSTVRGIVWISANTSDENQPLTINTENTISVTYKNGSKSAKIKIADFIFAEK